MLTVKDRNGQAFGLAPTAEEVVTDYAAGVVQSYKQLPVTYFQQHTKFRDEIRPRFGLMRVKEFIMMDAYSFHANDASLDATYQAMRAAYNRIFRRMGLEAFAVEADSGAIGGSGSHEFMVAADVGEDTILFCSASGYAANIERAKGRVAAAPAWSGAPAAAVPTLTPNVGAIADVVAFLQANGHPGVQAGHCLKCVLFVAKTEKKEFTVAAFVRGDRDVSEVKLANAIGRRLGDRGPVLELRPMRPEEVTAATSARPGFAGPGAGLTVQFTLVDETLKGAGPLVAGANKDDHHLVGFVIERDVTARYEFDDILVYRAGDGCPVSGQPLSERRGIEVGHVFKLGTKYSKAMQAVFTGEDGKRQPFIMGCYGIGSSRVVAAAVEQHHDQDGITWPVSIAPYHCVVVPIGKPDDTAVLAAATRVYEELKAAGVEAVLDDRDLKPGVKFKDWDLLGLPFKVVCGRGVAQGQVEFKARSGGGAQDIAIDGAAALVAAKVREELARLGR
jgi:prolyl-tRNA synthetase